MSRPLPKLAEVQHRGDFTARQLGILRARRERLLARAQATGELVLDNQREPWITWYAAIQLQADGKLDLVEERRSRIIMGPRPHNRFRTVRRYVVRVQDVV